MDIKRIKIFPTAEGDFEPFEAGVVQKYWRGSVNDYKLDHEKWKYFQYDTSDRPSDYYPEALEKISFRGYIITHGSKKNPRKFMEVIIKIVIDEKLDS